MKTLKLIYALIIVTTFTFSCTPTSLTEDSLTNNIEEVASDDYNEIDDDKD